MKMTINPEQAANAYKAAARVLNHVRTDDKALKGWLKEVHKGEHTNMTRSDLTNLAINQLHELEDFMEIMAREIAINLGSADVGCQESDQ